MLLDPIMKCVFASDYAARASDEFLRNYAAWRELPAERAAELSVHVARVSLREQLGETVEKIRARDTQAALACRYVREGKATAEGREQPIKPDEDHAIGSAQPEPRWRRPPQDNKLLAEKCHLGFASRMRSEHSAEQSAEQLQEVKHFKARIAHRGSCASPDTIFGSHSRLTALLQTGYTVRDNFRGCANEA